MSTTEQQPNQNSNDTQSGEVKNPLRVFLTAIFAFLIPIGALILVLEVATGDMRRGSTERKLSHEAVIERIQPVARVAFQAPEGDGDLELKTGEEVYNSTCATCHAEGIAGAPKFGDTHAWAPYIEAGYDELLKVALNGRGAMPAKGGNTSLDDLEVERAMVYMANAAGADFNEPDADGTEAADEAKADAADDQADDGQDEQDSADAAAEGDDADAKQDEADESTETAAADGDEFAATDEQLEIGKKLYDGNCFACHAAGVAGAPKFGDADAWKPYMETGLETMLEVAIKGTGAMPPRGGSTASDEELEAAILYMISETK